jgi:hypothetical protein
MTALNKAAILASAIGLVATGATVASAVAPGAATGSLATGPTTARQLAATTKPRVFAVVRSDGTLQRGRGATTTSRSGLGAYTVRFDRGIGKCAWMGTVGLGTFGGITGPGMVTLSGLSGTSNGLYVRTYNGDGNAADLPFHVVATCS